MEMREERDTAMKIKIGQYKRSNLSNRKKMEKQNEPSFRECRTI